MAQLAHTFESGQTSGTTITTANSGTGGDAFDSTSVGSGGALTYDSTASRGALSLKATTGATAVNASATWTTSLGGPWSAAWVRCTFRPDAFSSTGIVFRLRGAGVQTGRITYSSTGKIELRNSANSVVATSTASMSAGTWWRIVAYIPVGSSAVGTLYIYYDPASVDPDETINTAATSVVRSRKTGRSFSAATKPCGGARA